MNTIIRASFLLLCALLLCGSLLMWWRSHWTIDAIDWGNATHESQIMSLSGRLIFARSDTSLSSHASTRRLMVRSSVRNGVPPIWENTRIYNANSFLGFEWTPQVTPKIANPYNGYTIFPTSVVAVPWWAFSLLSFLPLLQFGIGYRRMAGRLGGGLCPVCGYDLRASPDRCPECGIVVSEFQNFPETLEKAASHE